jgi:hypothetical protein
MSIVKADIIGRGVTCGAFLVLLEDLKGIMEGEGVL